MDARRRALSAIPLALLAGLAQAAEEELSELDFSDMTRLSVSIASRAEQRQEEAPSIVSVITRKEIDAYGARDLADVLRMVPGFEFGIDVLSFIGLGYRGVWAHEGKILLMVDGQTLNDLAFGNSNFFGSYPVSIVERVEIIRGPGSALYGTFAEVGVINIVTRSGEALSGLDARGSIGKLDSSSSYSTSIAWGQKSGNFDVAGEIGRARTPVSDEPYVSFTDAVGPGGNRNAGREWQHVLFRAKYKDALKLNYARMQFDHFSNSGYGEPFEIIAGRNTGEFRDLTESLKISYQAKLAPAWVLEPTVELTSALPIGAAVNSAFPGSLFVGLSNELRRYRGELALMHDHAGSAAMPFAGKATLGVGIIRDAAESISSDGTPGLHLPGGALVFDTDVSSRYVFGQYQTQLKPFGVTLGARYESSDFGSSFAPRVGLTYVANDFNVKLLYGEAFRTPMPFQVYTRLFTAPPENLKPETSEARELEVGYRWTSNIVTRLNAFLITIEQPITYDGATNSYSNQGFLRARGVEGEARAEYPDWGTFFNLSYVSPGSRSTPAYLADTNDYFLGLSSVKLNWGAHLNRGRFTFAPSVTFMGKRYGQTATVTTGEAQEYSSLTLLNMAVNWRPQSEQVTLRLAGHNLLDEDYVLLQPYYGGHAPLPAQDREIRLEIDFRLR